MVHRQKIPTQTLGSYISPPSLGSYINPKSEILIHFLESSLPLFIFHSYKNPTSDQRTVDAQRIVFKNKMKDVINKSLACLVVFFLFLCFSLTFTGTVDYKSRFLSFLPQLSNSTFCRTGSPLRVYMYDLPRRFNVGMIDGSLPDETPVRAENFPAWRENNGLRKQHSVEYWMMASLLYNGDEDGDSGSSPEAVRVMDPELADVFFVPFFSSLSVNVHGRNMTDPDTEIDIKLQHEIVEILRGSEHWQRSAGRDHVIPIHHPNAFRIHRDKVNASIFIVADFGRIMSISQLAKDVVAPYVHMVESYLSDNKEDPYESRKTLLFFRGRTVRKEEGLVRVKLKRILGKNEDVIYEEGSASKEGFRAVSFLSFFSPVSEKNICE
ncbi:probable arabinosyltransferase ARAD1 [Olea europaea subsp. europaea]|uniref:Probable arabinosyltransferase ARAD1 n=1 Tax=Olea europaea subsp. europaea TaxID=158383 RepID=A0A8S0V933_OLEEU|nr:probable arabinosyltransferase ARAD1 [Olea europaea subsp. europaea]